MDEPKKIIILGIGGDSIDILDIIDDINHHINRQIYECVGFLDDNNENWGRDIQGIRVLGPLSHAQMFTREYFLNGIGSYSNFWKKDYIISRTGIPLERFVSIVHPTASVSRTSSISFGTVISRNVVLGPNTAIGNHVVVLSGSIINHDVDIGDYTIVTSGVCISGGVHIGKLCYLGTNSSIINNAVINDYCLVGMGSVVLNDIPERTVVVGNPAKQLRLIPLDT